MKILIVSDTHRYHENYLQVLMRVAPVDMVIHCGDIEGSEYTIAKNKLQQTGVSGDDLRG